MNAGAAKISRYPRYTASMSPSLARATIALMACTNFSFDTMLYSVRFDPFRRMPPRNMFRAVARTAYSAGARAHIARRCRKGQPPGDLLAARDLQLGWRPRLRSFSID